MIDVSYEILKLLWWDNHDLSFDWPPELNRWALKNLCRYHINRMDWRGSA